MDFRQSSLLKRRLPSPATSLRKSYSLAEILKNYPRKHWPDILLVIAIAALAAFASYQAAQLLDSTIVDNQAFNVWFDSDAPRVFANMTDQWSDHYRTKVHPLFSIIALPSVSILKTVLHVDPLTAVRLVIAAVAALWIGALFIVLRLIGCRRLDATIFSIVGATSAAAMFWFVIPETYPFGSLSILVALCLVAFSQYRKLSALCCTLASALTLSFTTTNWMVGILATMTNYRWKRALQISVNAFCLVVVLWGVEKFIIPSAQFFIGDREEKKFIFLQLSSRPLHVLKSFVSHTMVMPAIELVANRRNPDWPMMITQRSLPGSASLWGAIAVVLWTALLGLGIWGFFSAKQHRKLRWVLGLTILGQLALHAIYGKETFLYALHFAPLLVVLAAFSTLTPARPIALVLAGMLILTAGVNNSLQFSKATEFLSAHGSPRHRVLGQMQPAGGPIELLDGKQMHVKLHGRQLNVRLGSAFPAKTPLKMELLDS